MGTAKNIMPARKKAGRKCSLPAVIDRLIAAGDYKADSLRLAIIFPLSRSCTK